MSLDSLVTLVIASHRRSVKPLSLHLVGITRIPQTCGSPSYPRRTRDIAITHLGPVFSGFGLWRKRVVTPIRQVPERVASLRSLAFSVYIIDICEPHATHFAHTRRQLSLVHRIYKKKIQATRLWARIRQNIRQT